jgi:hypothetical protein
MAAPDTDALATTAEVPVVSRTQTPPDQDSSPGRTWADVARPVAWGVVAVAVVDGIVTRAWYLTHQPVNSDEAIVGLMARQILHGHFWAFYWGQPYGGGESYLVAALFAVFGSGALVMKLVSVLLAAGAAVLVARIVRRLVDDPLLAILAGALVWVAPAASVSNSTIELGFRGVTMACGLGVVLVTLRILDGRQHWSGFVLLGLLLGVGWWSSPEIVYFALPGALWVAGAIAADPEIERVRRWGVRLGLMFGATIVGALPWLWANVGSGFKSLNQSNFLLPPNPPDYWGRLGGFFRFSLPMLGNLRMELTGWPIGRVLFWPLAIVLAAVLVAALVLCWRRGGRSRALVVAVVAFPLILAVSPATWYWGDGRYTGFLFPLLVMVVVIGASEAAILLRQRRLIASDRVAPLRRVIVAGLVIFTVVAGGVGFVDYTHYRDPQASLIGGWGDPNGPSQPAITKLEQAGIRTGYANYWVAYRLDLLSGGTLTLTSVAPDIVRSTVMTRTVDDSKRPAWIFIPSVSPTSTAVAQFAQTAGIQGPNGLPEATFVADLQRMGIGYRVVNVGLIQAIVPDRRVTSGEIYFPPDD